MKKTGIIAFTEHGCVLGEKLLRDLQKQDQEIYGFVKSKYVDLPERHSFQKVTGTLREWAEEWIPKLDGIVFFSATGIAVRTIAPFVVSKKTDPAVVVIDEQGNYAISLLSGHLGGANELAKFAAESIGAVPVITTGTDVNHTFAVDVFARKNNLVIADMRLAKEMAALLIRGKYDHLGSRGRICLSKRTEHSVTAAISGNRKPGRKKRNVVVCDSAKRR